MGSIPTNRRLWNQISNAYQHEHDPQIGATPRLWGMYSILDPHLHALALVPPGADRAMLCQPPAEAWPER